MCLGLGLGLGLGLNLALALALALAWCRYATYHVTALALYSIIIIVTTDLKQQQQQQQQQQGGMMHLHRQWVQAQDLVQSLARQAVCLEVHPLTLMGVKLPWQAMRVRPL